MSVAFFSSVLSLFLTKNGILFEDPHFSRADVACDIIDLDDEYVNQYRLVDAVSFRPYYGQSGALETAYWGARSSERQVRLYNKKVGMIEEKRSLARKCEILVAT